MLHTVTRRLEEKGRRRASIVDAAEQLYAECGWDMLTVDEVARRARLSRALVYVYFRDKADLRLAIVERALTLIQVLFREVTASQAVGLDKVDAMGRAFATLAQERPHYFDACSRFQSQRDSGPRQAHSAAACVRLRSSILQMLGAAVTAGHADGSVRQDLGAVPLIALILWALMHGSLQIAYAKAAAPALWKCTEQRLIEQSLGLVRRMLQSSSITI